MFEAIHHHKARVKTVGWIAEHTGLSRKQVLTAGRQLVQNHIVEQVTKDGETAYAKNGFLQANKPAIQSLLDDRDKLREYPTKRKIQTTVTTSIEVLVSTATATQITIDDVDSFSAVVDLVADGRLPRNLSEEQFKLGIQKILGEPGEFKDWGGEKNDLMTTGLVMGGTRRSAAFAFKGPGVPEKLTPGRLGKNGDQLQRLLQSAADVFFVQHWREIDQSVLEQLRALATAKSATSGQQVWFGLIDGNDSRRILDAYPTAFPKVE